MTRIAPSFLLLFALVATNYLASAFVIHPVTSVTTQRTSVSRSVERLTLTKERLDIQGVQKSTTSLHAFLPPSNDRNSGIGPLATSLVTLGLTLAFFLSPLGAFVLSVFNSLLLLSILTPVFFLVGFNLWQYFNTISGTCPSCGAPASVMKRQESGLEAMMPDPTICFNCGAILVASPDNKEIDIASSNRRSSNLSSMSFFDNFFSSPSVQVKDDRVDDREEKAKRFRRERTVIDVDVED